MGDRVRSAPRHRRRLVFIRSRASRGTWRALADRDDAVDLLDRRVRPDHHRDVGSAREIEIARRRRGGGRARPRDGRRHPGIRRASSRSRLLVVTKPTAPGRPRVADLDAMMSARAGASRPRPHRSTWAAARGLRGLSAGSSVRRGRRGTPRRAPRERAEIGPRDHDRAVPPRRADRFLAGARFDETLRRSTTAGRSYRQRRA